jgi:alkanesulfonate monooxygenase SsuD/methylene tetrahydromethanopterin reductase-like flavin-dependent oxidoreductase (luciferase family)
MPECDWLARIKFGCQLPQEGRDFEKIVRVAEICERLGYDSIWAYDHLAPYWTRRGQVFECWALLAAVSQRTRKIKLGSLVTNVNLRNPALLAKITSSLDNLCGGRLILGLGTGDRMSRDELLSYGYSYAGVEERVERLREAVLILKAMWTKDRTTFQGRYHSVLNAVNYPKPVQNPHPPLWIGGSHLKLLDIVAETADGWNYWGLKREMLARRSKYLSDKCGTIGRGPEEITKSWAGKLPKTSESHGSRRQRVESIRERIRSQTDDQTKYFIASLSPRATASTYEEFAEAVKGLD